MIFLCLFKNLLHIRSENIVQTLGDDHAVLVGFDVGRLQHDIPHGDALRQHVAVSVIDTAPLCRQRRIGKLLLHRSFLQFLRHCRLQVQKPACDRSESQHDHHDHDKRRTVPHLCGSAFFRHRHPSVSQIPFCLSLCGEALALRPHIGRTMNSFSSPRRFLSFSSPKFPSRQKQVSASEGSLADCYF